MLFRAYLIAEGRAVDEVVNFSLSELIFVKACYDVINEAKSKEYDEQVSKAKKGGK